MAVIQKKKTHTSKKKKASKKKATKKTRTPKDPVTWYARQVVNKKIIAGPHVRNACARHLSDLKNQKALGIKWALGDAVTPGTALGAIGYFENVLHLAGGEYEGQPFKLLPWEAFIIGSVFGWHNAKTGLRRFRTIYVETGKGSGKSPLAAGVGLYMLCSDRVPGDPSAEPRAEIYAVATKRDQAMVLYRNAIAMQQQSPGLRRRLKKTGAEGREWNLYYAKTGSFFRPISTENTGKGQSGPIPHCNLFDEVHEHPTNAMIEFMGAGTKSRRQPLDFMITNSGYEKQSVCGEYHDYAVNVADPKSHVKDDSFFSYVCAVDQSDDPFKDEKCWIKTNPSLPLTPGYDYLRNQVTRAKGLPSKEALVRRLNFCEWVGSENPAFSREAWETAQDASPLEEFAGFSCVAALDLGSKVDLTSLTLAFEYPDEKDEKKINTYTYNEYWTPADTIKEREERDRSPYTRWVREGYLNTVPGSAIDPSFIAYRIKEINEATPIKVLAYDRWRIDDLIRELDHADVECYLAKIEVDDDDVETIVPKEKGQQPIGIALLPFGQGFHDMAPAVDDLEQDLANNEIKVFSNPVTTMCASNAYLEEDAAGNRKFSKKKSTGRIDGVVSLVMANRVIRLLAGIEEGAYYDDEDIFFI